MKEEDKPLFQENEACQGCECLENCREAKEPRRTSCWIRFCRERYWKPKLKEKKRRQTKSCSECRYWNYTSIESPCRECLNEGELTKWEPDTVPEIREDGGK